MKRFRNRQHFAAMPLKQAAEALGVAPRTADFLWAYAKAYLLKALQGDSPASADSAGG